MSTQDKHKLPGVLKTSKADRMQVTYWIELLGTGNYTAGFNFQVHGKSMVFKAQYKAMPKSSNPAIVICIAPTNIVLHGTRLNDLNFTYLRNKKQSALHPNCSLNFSAI